MVSALIVFAVVVSGVAAAFSLLRKQHSAKGPLGWDLHGNEIDVQVFTTLLNRKEEQYLLHALARHQFIAFQRRRLRLALSMLRIVENNASAFLHLTSDPHHAANKTSNELVVAVAQLRLNLMVAKLCLTMKWLFPTLRFSVPAFEVRYQHLLQALAPVQQRGWDPSR